MDLTILTGTYQRRSLLLVHSVNISALIEQVDCNLEVTLLACDRQRCVAVVVLCIQRSPCLNKSFYYCEGPTLSSKVQRCILIRSNSLDKGVKIFIIFVILVFAVELLFLPALVLQEQLD